MSAPLNKLVRKDSGFKSGALPIEAKKSFLALKDALITRPCLAPVDFNSRFIVTTDASETHYGSCLSQIGKDGIERPCGFSSKLLNDKESKQQPGIRERAALLHALRHWQPYLVGKEFTMRTDHNPNLSLMKGKTKSYDTLSDEIMQFMPFKMEFLNGNKMFVDALSRMPKATCAISQNPLKLFSSKSTPLLDLDILLAQQKRDPALLKAIMFHQGQISSADAPPLCPAYSSFPRSSL